MLKKLILLGVACLSIIGYVLYAGQSAQFKTEVGGVVTAQISVLKGGAKEERWEGVDGYAGRFLIGLGEELQLSIELANLEAGKPVSVEAPHGGVLNGDQSRFSWTPRMADEKLALSYRVGGSTGVYLITLRQGEREEVIEFWAGAEPSLGEAGPESLEAR